MITVIEAFAMLIGSGGGPLAAAIAMGRKDQKEAETIMGNCCYMLIFVTEGLIQSVFYKQLLTYGNNDYVTAMSIMFSINQVLVRLCQGTSEGAQPILSYNFGAGNQNMYRMR